MSVARANSILSPNHWFPVLMGIVIGLAGVGVGAMDSCGAPTTLQMHSTPKTPAQHGAGCLVRSGEHMLGIIHSEGGGFGPPGGRFVLVPTTDDPVPDQTLADTAMRETRQETGYQVEVVGLLGSVEGDDGTQFVLFHCELVADEQGERDSEARAVVWDDPKGIPAEEWRIPEQREWIVGLFAAL